MSGPAPLDGLPLYQTLRALTSPLVALTTSAAGRRNGMIANSAQRASLVPERPRVSVYISKTNFSHDLVYASGVLGMHLLRADQWEIVRVLGLRTGRTEPKLHITGEREEGDAAERVEAWLGDTGCPLIRAAPLALECRVVNTMDAGAATFFLADVVTAWAEPADALMTSEHFRANAPAELRRLYEARLVEAQADLARLANAVDDRPWPGAKSPP